jgi:hypothetical protein
MAGGLIGKSFILSETIKPTGEPCFPLRKLRKYIVESYRIEEKNFKEYMYRLNSAQYHPYIDTLTQKLFHPTKEDLETDEIFMNGIRIL